MKIYMVLVVVVMFFLNGCSNMQMQKELSNKKEMPGWYKNPPKNTATSYFSVGEGINKDNAIADALSSFASTLSVNIESEFTIKQEFRDGFVHSNEEESLSKIHSSVKNMRLSSYEVIKIENIGFEKTVVLIELDKEKLFLSLDNELKQKLNSTSSEIDSYNLAKKLSSYKQIKDDLIDIENSLIIMSILNPNFNQKEHLTKAQGLRAKYNKLVSKVSFSIECDSDSKILKSAIISGLSKQKMEVKESSKDVNTLRIVISSNVKRSQAYGFFIASSATDIVIKDASGNIVGGNKLDILGQSALSYEMAKESVAIKLNDMIKKDGISKIIGFVF